MQRIHRVVAVAVGLGALAVALGGCQSFGTACGAIFNLALGLGAAVGSYYLVQALS